MSTVTAEGVTVRRAIRVPRALHTGVPRELLVGGFLATTLLSVAGIGAGAVPLESRDAVAGELHLTFLRGSAGARDACDVVVLLAMILLLSCWWRLRPYLDDLAPRGLLVVIALWSLPLLFAPPLFSGDIYAYAGQGHLVANHYDPYIHGPGTYEPRSKWSVDVAGIYRFAPAPYGPVWLYLAGRIVSVSGDHLVPALYLLRALPVLGLFMVGWGLPKIARAHGVPPQKALWLALANPFVLLHAIAGAHNDALMIGLLVWGVAVAGQHPTVLRLVAATVLITVGALIKVPAAAALGFLPMLMPGWGARIRAGALVAVTAAATSLSLTAATGLGWGWIHTLSVAGAEPSIWSPLTGIGVLVGNLLTHLGVVNNPQNTLRLTLEIGFVVTALLAFGLFLRARHVGVIRALALSLVAVVALGSIVQPWYLLWGLVLLAATPGRKTHLALAALSVALCLTLLPNGRSLIRPPLYGAPVLAAVVFAAVLVRRDVHEQDRLR